MSETPKENGKQERRGHGFRVKRFVMLVWQDIGIEREQILPVLFCSLVVAVLVMIPVAGLALFLKWVTGHETMDGAFEASVGILMMLFFSYLAVGYIWRKWREA